MKKKLEFVLLAIIVCIASHFFSAPADAKQPEAAIIIDDFGGNVKGVDSFLAGQIPITVAIMPFLEQTKEQAERAHAAGLEVIVHLPLEPKKGKASWLGPKGITNKLSDEEIRNRVHAAIADVPHAVGLNNHMGSKIVEDERIMRIIMEIVKEHSLYMIDSGTSNRSVIPLLANDLGIPYGTRDIFLEDSLSSRGYVETQMGKLAQMANKNGKAIAIGHVGIKGEETAAGVKNSLERFKQEGITLVPVSKLIQPVLVEDFHDF